MKVINIKTHKIQNVKSPSYQSGGGLPMGLPNVGGLIASSTMGTPDTKGEKIGAGIGAGVDPLLNLLVPGLGQLGAGRLAGQAIGSLFKPDTSDMDNYNSLNAAMRTKKNDVSNPYGNPVYQTGGDVEPQYEAEDNEVVIKQHPGEQVNMHGTGKLVDESSYAGTIKGDTHEEGGEDMSGGEYILSDKKTLDYLDAGKRNGKSVAALARPLVKKIKDAEETDDVYKKNALKHHVDRLESIKKQFDSNKQKHEAIDNFLNSLDIQDQKQYNSHKAKLIQGLNEGSISLEDFNQTPSTPQEQFQMGGKVGTDWKDVSSNAGTATDWYQYYNASKGAVNATASKTFAKTASKSVPLLGAALATPEAIEDFNNGDYLRAALQYTPLVPVTDLDDKLWEYITGEKENGAFRNSHWNQPNRKIVDDTRRKTPSEYL